MFAYVARQAIFDSSREVYAYEVLFRDGKQDCFPDIRPDEATSKLLAENQLTLGIEEISDAKPAFINFHEHTLLRQFPTFLDPQHVVIEIINSVPVTDRLVRACQEINDLGYKLAIDDYDFTDKWEALLPIVRVVKVDISKWSAAKVEGEIARFKGEGITLIAEHIETQEQFAQFADMGFDYFQGYFFARPELLRKKSIPATKLVLLDLMEASCAYEFDFDRINNIITRDVGLSYMLLRFINCPVINKRNKITSLRHALTYMGEVEVKKFIALLALANLADDKPRELVHMSLTRAKFCELLAMARRDADNPPKGFLVGLFSLLDAMLDQSMAELMEKVPLIDELKEALLGIENVLKDYLTLARALENANWSSVKKLSLRLELDQRMVHSFYNESIKWGRAMTNSVPG